MRSTRKNRKSKKLAYNMRGCSKKMSRRRSRGQKGGCGGCSSQMGGSVPLGNIGAPWTPNNLPASTLIGGNNNYYPLNTYKSFDPTGYLRLTKGGGKGKHKKMRGGGLIPQDLLNLGRSASYNVGSIYNALGGYHAPVNPLPYAQQYGYGKVQSFPIMK
jgi:hypothetical protein